jgi:hypothetical protein
MKNVGYDLRETVELQQQQEVTMLNKTPNLMAWMEINLGA